MFRNAYSLREFIDGQVDKGVNPEETHNRLLGNIQIFLANEYEDGRLLTTNQQPSVLGPIGDSVFNETVYYTDGTCSNLKGDRSVCPRSFYDDSFPTLNSGDSAVGINDNKQLRDIQNFNIGFNLNRHSSRSIHFPYSTLPDSTFPVNEHSPELEFKIRAGTKAPHYTSYQTNYGINEPVGDWTTLNPTHGH